MAEANVALSWSSGKDAAWTLHRLRGDGIDVRVLITTFNDAADRVAMHAVRRELVRAQAESAGIPLIEVGLPAPCTNADYERIFGMALDSVARGFGIDHIAFGDLFLDDIREYRCRQLVRHELKPLFPLWGEPTDALGGEMIAGGLKACVTCVESASLDANFAGRSYDRQLLDELPAGIDPCGENGEFHTFAWDGPMFDRAIEVAAGTTIQRDGFWFTDLIADPVRAPQS